MKNKTIVVRNRSELARALRLSPVDMMQIEVQSRINDKIIEAVARSGMTRAQVAKAAGTSRTCLTAILNRNTAQASTDLMLRILAALGYRPKITFTRTRAA